MPNSSRTSPASAATSTSSAPSSNRAITTKSCPDIVGVLKLQGGNITGWGGKDLRMLDHFQMGPTLVRGFAPAGFGPRDLTPGTTNDALGGSMYWGASVEAQTPLYFLPKEVGIKFAVFADAGSLWSYKGPTTWSVTRARIGCSWPRRIHEGPLLGRRRPDLGFAARPAALRSGLSDDEILRAPRRRHRAGVRPSPSSSASAAARSSDLGCAWPIATDQLAGQ